MSAAYLVRFDDICPTMNWRVWSMVEQILIENEVRPVLAVVPNNKDEKLEVGIAAVDFWERVRAWQERGWTIGLHGYQHDYVTQTPGIVGLNRRSEFSGLPRPEQGRKLEAALAIFKRERVRPDVWIAPAHSFDETTLELLCEFGLRHVSDGFALLPYTDARGVTWVPQQLWRFRDLPLGVWTVCLHLNDWNERQLGEFSADIKRYQAFITCFGAVIERYGSRRRGLLDALAEAAFLGAHRARRFLSAG